VNIILLLAPLSLLLALGALGSFIWSVRNGQYEDPRGDAERILQDSDRPL
jgi:cbb3-type cytochrome oxidase maturation protein